jgi:hypothetical protein
MQVLLRNAPTFHYAPVQFLGRTTDITKTFQDAGKDAGGVDWHSISREQQPEAEQHRLGRHMSDGRLDSGGQGDDQGRISTPA